MNIITRRLVTASSKNNSNLMRMFSTAQPQKNWADKRVLVAGCRGQIGSALTQKLIDDLGSNNVVAADLVDDDSGINCKYYKLDITDKSTYEQIVKDEKIDYIIHLAAILSSLGEQYPELAYDVNVTGGTNAFEIARDNNCQIYMPSSIAVFGGDNFQKDNTPNDVILQPKTIYGVSKVFNELLGEYYSNKYGIDFRSIRYPGVISSAKYAFNGTTDYSTEIFFHALENNDYKCWLNKDQALPMIYIDDCVDATMTYLKADKATLKRNVYNLAGISFTPQQLAVEVQKLIPDLTVTYDPCARRSGIAAEWPRSLDDQFAREEWGWKYDITTYDLAHKILDKIAPEYKEGKNLNMNAKNITQEKAFNGKYM